MLDDAPDTAFADHFSRCGGDASVHSAGFGFVTALEEIISEVRIALGVGVEALMDPKKLDGLPADVGVVHYNDIRCSKVFLYAVVYGLFDAFSAMSPKVVVSPLEKTKFDKYSEGLRSRPDTCPLHSLCGHGIRCSRRPRYGFFYGACHTGSRL
jgi:hypothetical protein